MSEPNRNPRALVIMAHPDDPEFSAGGTIAKWTSEGVEVSYAIVTNGNKGSDDPNITPQQLIALRVQEQQAAGDILGVRNIVFMGYEDGYVVPDLALRRDLVRVIRQFQPDIVVTGDARTLVTSGGWINHPDHRAVGLATLDAIFPAARNRNYFPELLAEGIEPWYVREVYLSGTLEPDTWIDITVSIERKIAAILAHKSQIKEPDGLAQRIRERTRKQDSSPDQPIYVEGFRLLKL